MNFKKPSSLICSLYMLISGIFCNNAIGYPYKVVLVGDSQVGKTQIAGRLSNPDLWGFDKIYTPTQFIFTYQVMYNDIDLSLWDTSGAINYRHILKSYLNIPKVFNICLNVSKNDYMERLNYWSNYASQYVNDTQKIIVLNKIDVCSQNRIYVVKQKIMGKHPNIPTNQIIPCSAKNNQGINQLRTCIFSIVEQ